MNSLPSDEHTFTVKIKGSKTGRVYEGTFTYKLPDLRTDTEISKTYARLSEGLKLDDDTNFLYDMLSYLANTFTKSPEWWREEAVELKIRDFNVFTELRTECLNFEKKWNDQVWGSDEAEEKSGANKEAS